MKTVYLIHFKTKYKHAQHYLGFTDNLDERIKRHKEGHGAVLMSVITKEGIAWEVVRTWQGTRKKERTLKNRKKSRKLCPTCMQIEKHAKKITKICKSLLQVIDNVNILL